MNLRELFLLDPDIVFLNHGSFGACPAPVFAEYQRWQRELERRPVEFLGRRSGDLLGSALQRLAAYLHTVPERLVFLTNTTTAVNTIARSLPLAPGDEVLTTNQEYGACDNVWRHACRLAGAAFTVQSVPLPFPSPDAFVDLLWSRVTPRTRVIALSHITSTTALIFPLAEICRRARAAGILTVIDGAHAPGHLDLDLAALGADYYAGNCHKWLCAPKGSAFLHVGPGRDEALDAAVISWGYSEGVAGHTAFDAYLGNTPFHRRHLWQGTRDIAAFLTVPTAIDFQAEHQWGAVRARCHALARESLAAACALSGLAPVSRPEAFGQMVAVPVPPCDPEALKAKLYDEFHLEAPVTTHEDRTFVRLSFQGYNTEDDAAAFLDAFKRLLDKGFFS